jgi:TRAP-type C4-dicarboxylate transport system substrate-binding protein
MSQSSPTGARRRTLLKTSLAVIAAPAVIGTAKAQSTVTWKVQAHWPKASSSFKDSLEWFAAELSTRTKGRFKMQLFGAGELAKDAEIYNIVRRGVVEMGTLAPAYILNEAEAMGLAYGVPGTFREPWHRRSTRSLRLRKRYAPKRSTFVSVFTRSPVECPGT